jgi:trimeric autotransporter adhesin
MVEDGMGNDGTGRRSPWNLFAERQVHMRSGQESRYVVLSRSLQIGVTAGFLAILALLAIASYNAIAKHVALAAQERTLEEFAARAARAEQVLPELASLRQRNEAAEREIERLSAALDQAQAERSAAVTASSEAGAKAAELEAALATTLQESRKLGTDLEAMRAAGEVRSAPGSPPGSRQTQALLAEITGLRAELERVDRETEALRRTAAQARQALREAQGAGEAAQQARSAPPLRLAVAASPATDEVQQLQQDLAGAQASLAALSADLEAAKGAATGAGPATDAAADLAALKQQLSTAHRRAEQLGVRLAGERPKEVGDAPSDPAPSPSPPAPR